MTSQPSSSPRRLSWFGRLFQAEGLNFALTNQIPRRLATRFMGWFSRIRFAPIRWSSIRLWRLFAGGLDLGDAKKARFDSLHDLFIRELKPGARAVDPDPHLLTSPCDAVVGAHGTLDGIEALQVKGSTYDLLDLMGDRELVERHRDGLFVTLRLKSTMYHRFHAPCDCRVHRVNYISGDCWNVNPIALRRVSRLFCKNERAVLPIDTRHPDETLTLVPVAAVLVASIQLNFMEGPLDLRSRGSNHLDVEGAFEKGAEMGYFQHGSTILMFASGPFELARDFVAGETIRMGEPLLRRCPKGDGYAGNADDNR